MTYRAALAGLALVTACGGSSGPAITAADYIELSIEAKCQREFDCMSSYDVAMHDTVPFATFVGGATVADCIATADAGGSGSAFGSAVQASVDAGRITYEDPDATICIDAENAETCDEVFEQNGQTAQDPNPCPAVLVGTVAQGSACTLDIDCVTLGETCGADHTCDP